MSVDDDAAATALAGDQLTMVSLPPRRSCPASWREAVERFDAGDRPAAVGTARWLREDALDQHGSARTFVWVGTGRAHGFFALSAGVAQVSSREKDKLDAGPYPLPAVLLAQAARAPDGALPGGAILTGALAMATRVHRYVGVGALMLHPFDAETSTMWRRRGFKPVQGKTNVGTQRPLWRALA